MMINGLMPLTAPTIGAFILLLGNWRNIYGMMTLCGLMLMVGLICASNFAMGMIGPSASFAAVQHLPRLAGPASAVLACTQMVFGAASSAMQVPLFGIIGPPAIALLMFGCASAATIICFTRPNSAAATV